jgi:hypothetical protein
VCATHNGPVQRTSSRADSLATGLREAAERLAARLEEVDDPRWHRVPRPGTWSIGKEVEHVAEALGYHGWIVHRTVGDTVSSRRPALERSRMTPELGLDDALELLRRQVAEIARLVGGLTDGQLDLPTRPPRANAQPLAVTIERVLIGHVDAHRASIEAKLHR